MPTISLSLARAATLVAVQWHLSTLQTSWVTGAAILGAFVGAFTFGRVADVIGRKKVYVTVAVDHDLRSDRLGLCTQTSCFLVIARLVLGLGIGGDYPGLRRDYERVLEPAGPRSPGRSGLFHAGVGPHRWSARSPSCCCRQGIGNGLTWRILLGLGAVPAAAVVYLRSKMPESPRYLVPGSGQFRSGRQADLEAFLGRGHNAEAALEPPSSRVV
jgi:PHS family inorganic phosphate transporter-like MFS transporter